jgi:thiol-disulfide isomerase/thioredoxin
MPLRQRSRARTSQLKTAALTVQPIRARLRLTGLSNQQDRRDLEGRPDAGRRTPWLPCVAMVLALLFLAPAGALAIKPGQTAPEIEGPLLDGSGKLSLSAYRGKVVYVDFWASWCPPCLAAVPALEKLRAEFANDDFQIIAVNVDKKPKKARKFLAKNSTGYPSVSDPKGAVPASYGLETMPTSYLVDRSGVVRYVHEGFRDGDIDEIRRQIRRWMKQ